MYFVQTVIDLNTSDKHDRLQWYTLHHHDDTSSSVTSASWEVSLRKLLLLFVISLWETKVSIVKIFCHNFSIQFLKTKSLAAKRDVLEQSG